MLKIVLVLTFLSCGFEMILLAHPSWGIVLDDEGSIYFADITRKGRGAVWKLTNDRKLQLIYEDFHAHNVSIDKYGRLLSAHGEGQHIMLRRYKCGYIDTLFQTSDYRSFNGGNCSYTQSGEIIFSVDNYLWKLDKNGHKSKISEYYLGWNQVVYSDATYYYATDISGGSGKLIRFDKKGNAKVIARGLISKTDSKFDPHKDILLGMCRGEDGAMFIAELAGRQIIKINENGTKESFYKSVDYWFPTGIYFHKGVAFILEYRDKGRLEGPRIIKYDESGKPQILFSFENGN